jgi:hypothetical protein
MRIGESGVDPRVPGRPPGRPLRPCRFPIQARSRPGGRLRTRGSAPLDYWTSTLFLWVSRS